MLRHRARRIFRPLVLLLVLAAAIAPLPSPSATPRRPAGPLKYCDYAVDEFGNCVAICCDKDGGCMSYPCS